MIDRILTVAGTLFPLVFLLALGITLRARKFVDEAFASKLNTLIFRGALPAMVVLAIAGADVGAASWGPSIAVVAVTVLTWIAAALVAPLARIPRASRPTFYQASFRSNDVYVGIPVLLFAGESIGRGDAFVAIAAFMLAPALISYNVFAVFLLSPRAEGGLAQRCYALVRAWLHNPLILAVLIGVALLVLREKFGVTLPKPVEKTVGELAKTATCGSLVALGASITRERIVACFARAHAAVLVKLVVAPLLALAYCVCAGIVADERFVVLIMTGCPSAVASFVMARAMGGDAPLAGSTVALTTLWSIIPLSLILLFALPAA